ncbi:hypothetical protein Sango_2850300 [Sesamum angolense]|uniref:Reverse transcriptase RNase H-like domain-containing protein n=1 Tax=Sesamum angolense TaxID=2727404 RepID=A0AAE1T688_9LAMI|nr:hypothetical protein Sango_2850300 [Sesamum angolense]
MMLEAKPCIILTLARRIRQENLSTMQLGKGRKRNEPSYLCTFHFDEIEQVSGLIPSVGKKLLKEFEDMIPNDLPPKLPPKRAMDHEIKLVPHEAPAREDNEAKTTMMMRHGAFKFLVMPFGLTKTPATFTTLMDQTEMVTDLVLAIPDMTKPFAVKPMLQMSAQKELLAVVYDGIICWAPAIVVKTDNTAVSYFMTQSKLTNRQTRLEELLSEFHLVLEYWTSSNNHAAEALNHKVDWRL